MARRNLSSLFWAVLSAFLLVGLAQAAEFSAKVVSKGADNEKQGKIYVKGDKVRREFSTSGGTSTVILRLDKKVIWMLMPGQKVYLDMPFDKEEFAKAMNLHEDQVSKKPLGTEKLHGYDTEKYESSIKTEAGELRSTIWFSKQLGVPLRIESADKSFRQDYQEIKEGGVDDALFEIPAGYQKMPAMPQMK
jgi:outer membrane lipoprotein-sorting protein